ncbi:MAG: hypothetical protein QOD83_4816 [Solirubrobacteraceae bacterium]|jgi:hypothetical protein|nr:hypothetical protein [Solirubrobacteraceae bacterium]
MAFSRTAPRHEITYLRRRPKVGERRATPPARTSSSLSLAGAAQQGPKIAVAPVRRVAGRAMLSADAPTVTLNRRQSAIGSLAFDLFDGAGGALSCAWELVEGEAGLVSAALDVRVSPEFGRRPIVQSNKEQLIVGLRHVRRLRRLLLLASGLDGSKPARLVGELHDGGTVESPYTAIAPVVAAIAVYQVDGELVIRRENFGFPSAEAAAAAYGFSLTWLPPVRR